MSLTPTLNGIYSIISFTASQLTLQDQHGTGVWSPGETGTITILRPRLTVGEEGAFSQKQGLSGGVVINGLNRPVSFNDDAAALIFARESAAALNAYASDGRLQAIITKDGTIDVQTTGTPGGIRNELLRLGRFDNTDWGQLMLLAEMGDVSSIPFAALQPVENSPHLIKLEAVTLAGGTITFTRGGVDLTEYNGQIDTEQQRIHGEHDHWHARSDWRRRCLYRRRRVCAGAHAARCDL
jgi:hypothetical protein